MDNYKAIKPLYDLEKEGGMTITLHFTNENLKYLREKFDIEDKQDLINAIFECINTYMEM